MTQPYLLSNVYTRHPLPFTRKVIRGLGFRRWWLGGWGGGLTQPVTDRLSVYAAPEMMWVERGGVAQL